MFTFFWVGIKYEISYIEVFDRKFISCSYKVGTLWKLFLDFLSNFLNYNEKYLLLGK